MATDKDAEVRQTGKRVWAMFTEYWPERVDEWALLHISNELLDKLT
jgi:hypothetical protein